MFEISARSLHLLLEIGLLLKCSWRDSNCRNVNFKQGVHIELCMDLEAEPCNDFHTYACGNWKKAYDGADSNIVEPVTLLDYNVNVEMHKLLDEFVMKNEPKFMQQVRNYYESCKNLEEYDIKNYHQWLQLHEQFAWPAKAYRTNGAELDWVETLAKMRIYNFNEIFIQQIFINKVNDVNTFVIELNKPDGFSLLTKTNFEYIMGTLPETIEDKDLENFWQKIEQFEKKLTKLNESKEVENKSFIKFKDLPLDWLKKYLSVALNQTVINPTMELFIQDKSYILALDKLLQEYDQYFLNMYLQIRFLCYLYSQGPNYFSEVTCLSSTRSLMPTAIHWLYEYHHPELSNEYATIYEIFNGIRQQFRKTIQMNKHGFNDQIVKHLLVKLDRMQLKLNNIPRKDTLATLEKFHQDLDLHEEDFYGNHLKLLRFNFNAHRTLLDKSKIVLDFTYLESENIATSCSPYFMDAMNTIFVPLTLLQQPLYNAHLDNVYKYSSLGFLIAHEMFHAFDNEGLLKDANGNERHINFKENHVFNNSLNCFLNINPAVINEKIADISGLHYAYQAFFDTHSEQLFPLQPIYRQLFFLNFAQFFCGRTMPNEIGTHGSDRDRVMDALAHFPEFASAYKCSRSSRLYAHEACALWH